MPALYAVAQHAALHAVAATLQPGVGVFAFLDIVCAPERVAILYAATSQMPPLPGCPPRAYPRLQRLAVGLVAAPFLCVNPR